MTDKEAYLHYVKNRARHSPLLRNCMAAFLVGGGICLLGQLLFSLYRLLGAGAQEGSGLVSLSFIFFSALATVLGVFDRIARYGGAGTLVPITGFANAVVSPAIDKKSEGFVAGVGTGIFTVAGPVLLYGCAAATLYGLIYWVILQF